ncbi:hypothetical protein [Fictibacillus enclensis]|uniref:hypothetical protein n=1 Tax=Fictibacillus enclensis TaxID=1017270 RepID=UPI0024BFCA45|nr:hypothetical protein [Fictibacillus enclensis]WHY74088.1 hypothetical protein QNH15_09360 [Fictibacillus enclensis]
MAVWHQDLQQMSPLARTVMPVMLAVQKSAVVPVGSFLPGQVAVQAGSHPDPAADQEVVLVENLPEIAGFPGSLEIETVYYSKSHLPFVYYLTSYVLLSNVYRQRATFGRKLAGGFGGLFTLQ